MTPKGLLNTTRTKVPHIYTFSGGEFQISLRDSTINHFQDFAFFFLFPIGHNVKFQSVPFLNFKILKTFIWTEKEEL